MTTHVEYEVGFLSQDPAFRGAQRTVPFLIRQDAEDFCDQLVGASYELVTLVRIATHREKLR